MNILVGVQAYGEKMCGGGGCPELETPPSKSGKQSTLISTLLYSYSA